MAKLHLSRTPLFHLPPIFLAPCLLLPPTRSISTSARRPKKSGQAKEQVSSSQDAKRRAEAKESARREEARRTSRQPEASGESTKATAQRRLEDLIDPSPSPPAAPPSFAIHSAYLDHTPTPSSSSEPSEPTSSTSSPFVVSEPLRSGFSEDTGSSIGGQSIKLDDSPPSSSTSNAPSPTETSLSKASRRSKDTTGPQEEEESLAAAATSKPFHCPISSPPAQSPSALVGSRPTQPPPLLPPRSGRSLQAPKPSPSLDLPPPLPAQRPIPSPPRKRPDRSEPQRLRTPLPVLPLFLRAMEPSTSPPYSWPLLDTKPFKSRTLSPPPLLANPPTRERRLSSPSSPPLLPPPLPRSLVINPSVTPRPARIIPKLPPKPPLEAAALKDALVNLLLTSSTQTEPSVASTITLALARASRGGLEDPSSLVWSLYSSLSEDRLPPSLLPLLFNSQRVLDLSPEERARRLLRIFRDASRDPPLSVPASASFGESPRWWLSLEQLEETFESALRAAETGDDASASIGISILLREVWSAMAVKGGGGRQLEATRDGLLWRWVGLSLPRAPEGEVVGLVHRPPSSSTLRILQLARLLDQVGSPSDRSVGELGRSFLGGRTDLKLVEEVQVAIEQTEERRRRRDNELHPSKFSTEDKKTRRIINSDPHSFQTKKVVGMGNGKDVESWIRELLPSLDELPSNASEADLARSAPYLLHRTTTSILLLSHLERRVTHNTPRHLVAQIVASIHLLSSLPSHLHVPNSELRLFTSTLLQAYPTLQVVETEDIYRLLTAFVAVEDLPFASRLYRCFRLRAPEFVLSGHLLQKLIELSIGLRSTSVPEVEDTSLSSHDGVLGADVYADFISQGNPPLELDLLLPFVEQMGRRPTFGGVAFRAVMDSLGYHGEGLLTDELMIVLAEATSRRVLKYICDSADPTKDVQTEVSATDVLELLPFFRGFCRPPRTPPPKVFTLAINLVDSHPTPSNLALLDATFEEMLSHGPTPTLETVNALISAHLKRGKERASFMAFAAREPFDSGRIDMGRVVALVEVLTTRLGIRPNRDTWSLLVEGFLETRRTQTEVALEAFFHAHQEGEGTYQRATTLLVERLLIEERVEEASKVVEMHERAIKKEAIGGTRFAAAKHAVEQALKTRSSILPIEDVAQARLSMPKDASVEVREEEEGEGELVAVMVQRDGRPLSFSQA